MIVLGEEELKNENGKLNEEIKQLTNENKRILSENKRFVTQCNYKILKTTLKSDCCLLCSSVFMGKRIYQQAIAQLIRDPKCAYGIRPCPRTSDVEAGLEIACCQWLKAGHILETAGENKTGLPN